MSDSDSIPVQMSVSGGEGIDRVVSSVDRLHLALTNLGQGSSGLSQLTSVMETMPSRAKPATRRFVRAGKRRRRSSCKTRSSGRPSSTPRPISSTTNRSRWRRSSRTLAPIRLSALSRPRTPRTIARWRTTPNSGNASWPHNSRPRPSRRLSRRSETPRLTCPG